MESQQLRIKKSDTRYHISHDHVNAPLRFGELMLFQIGRTHCKETTVIGKHAHLNWFELTVATDGKGIVFTNGKNVSIQRGDIFLSFPGDIHGISSDPGNPLKYDFCAFYPLDQALVDELEQIMRDRNDAEQRLLQDERLSFSLANALAEMNRPSSLSARLMESILMQTVLYVIGDMRALSAREPHRVVEEKEELCYRMMNYVDTHIYSIASLGELADVFCYNYSYLSNLFHEVTKESLKSYYQNRRLEVAKRLIQEGALTLSRVAELLHYSSIYTFSRSFKEKYGYSPTQYKQEHL